MQQQKTMPARNEIPVEQTWDLAAIFPTLENWKAAYDEVERRLPEMEAHQGRLAAGAGAILAFMEVSEELERLAGRVFSYAMLESAADSTDQAALGRMAQVRGLFARLRGATAFAEPEFIAIGFERLREWMQVAPALKMYAHYFQRLEDRAEHIRSGDVEEVLALADDPLGTPRSVYAMLTNADMTFDPAVDAGGEEHEVGQSTIDGLLHSTDRALRRSAWESYSDGYIAFKNTLSATLLGGVKKDVFNMRARGYGSSLEASLSPNRIPLSVFHNLIDVFKKNLPLWQRYWGLRRKALDRKSVV